MRFRSVLLTLALAACEPDLPTDDGLVTAPRVLAVRGDPAEAKPGTAVTYTAFVALPDGSATAPPIAWAYCTAPKPPGENNVVSPACLGPSSTVPAGSGPVITAEIPSTACALFGPDTPPGGFRPRDPDDTGGYYQPLRAELAGSEPAFHLERLLCDLGMAPAEIATTFAAEYTPNQNPHLMPLSASIAGVTVSFDAIPKGTRVRVVASWSSGDAETFSYFDRTTESVTTRREAMSLAWYVSAGQLDVATTGRAEADFALSTDNVWTTPSSGGHATLWVVLRDSRGGVDFAVYDAQIVP
jgi:hypothetical protein